MIPKIIHYCWLSGNPIPSEYRHYMRTWKKHLPDYDMVLWDLCRFDINSSVWTKKAFEAKKYAFAADYIRMYALYNLGGIYFDLDVEVIKNMDELLLGREFFCYETDKGGDGIPRIEAAVFGCEKGLPWTRECIRYFDCHTFSVTDDGNVSPDIKVLPVVMRECMESSGYTLMDINP